GSVLLLVMEYVHGESLQELQTRSGVGVPIPVALAIATDVLEGLHAAHEARTERGEPLALVHRDVSPQNVMVGEDGMARLLDFGSAKAAHRLHTTAGAGTLKGKCGYMAREQVLGEAVDRRTDIYAAGTVLWEMLAGRRLFDAENTNARL